MAASGTPGLDTAIPQTPFATDSLVEAAHVLGDNPIFVVEWHTRRILACNDAVARVFGYRPAELAGRDTRVLHVSDASFEAFGAMSEAHINSGATAFHCHYRMRRRNGEAFASENLVQLIHDGPDTPVAVVSFVRDLSECVEPDGASEPDPPDGTPHPLAMDIPGAVFQRIRDAQGRDAYTYIAGRLLAEQGVDSERARADPEEIFRLIDPDDRRMYEAALASTAQSLSGIDMVVRMYPPGGGPTWLRVISRPTPLQDGSVVWDGIAIDISREKHAQDWATWLASHDQLTGLLNRAEFSASLDRQIDAHARRSDPIAVAQLGVRGMLKVNETHGFGAGDEILRALGERLSAVLGPRDLAARSHGDIFLVKLDAPVEDAGLAAAVQELRSVCAQPFRLDGGERLHLDLSIGVARFPGDGDDAESLLRAAALAADRAHAHPERICEFYDAELGDEVRWRFRMEHSLRAAIEAEELRPYYQPQVSLADGSLAGLEALIRWPQPDGSLVSPGAFVSLAEETGLITPMGRLLLRQVARDLRAWSSRGLAAPTVAVNCSARELRAESFVDDLRRELLDPGIEPAAVHLELTESTLVEDFDRAERVMRELTRLGVGFSIDDFGTGFSSLAYLSRLPFQVLKIDRSFIAEVTTDERRHAITLGLVRMAAALGLYTIAEGIETAEQAETLRAMGCDAGQGFLYDAALPPDAVERWLDARR